jgi:nitronate monooxygenase
MKADASTLRPISTAFTELLGCMYPIIAGPMFLVSDENLVTAVSEAGGLGATPSLNWRTTADFRTALRTIKSRTSKPFGVNLIVNQANPRQHADLEVCAEEKVPLIVTSLGNPKETIRRMHEVGCKVFCDVTTLPFAQKVQDLGADGVIAVSAGAGGHAGPISPLVLIPHLKKHLKIPVIAAGGIATGEQMAAAMLLGASAVQIGTRFIAAKEAKADDSYKNAILKAEPEDIVLTKKISGTPAAVINTDYVKKQGLELNPLEAYLFKNPKTKKYMKMARAYLGAKVLEKAAAGTTWKEVWSAGQGVGLIDEILTSHEIIEMLVRQYYEACERLSVQAGLSSVSAAAAKSEKPRSAAKGAKAGAAETTN